MTSHIFCGTFEAESHWREPDLATLPALRDNSTVPMLSAMDEMLFAFCEKGDKLVTIRRMDPVLVDYLHAVGFVFDNSPFDLISSDELYASDIPPNVFHCLNRPRTAVDLNNFLSGQETLEPFAILGGIDETEALYDLTGQRPALAVVRDVNTKGYSVRMRDRLGLPNIGVIVENGKVLLEQGLKLLQTGPFLIKDDYGVSGKGNQHITGEGILRRIAKYLEQQQRRGKKVRFVLETFLDKEADFSCQFHITPQGEINVLAVQQLENNGLAFGSSRSAPDELLRRLEDDDYFGLMRNLGASLFTDGYFGDVCVDSMLLRDGSLAPLVEINARKSMSLIKHALDGFVARFGRTGILTHVPTSPETVPSFPALLDRLEKTRLLFTPQRGVGILPLTAGTMLTRARTPGASQRGRLYCYVVFEALEQRAPLLAALQRLASSEQSDQ